MSWRRHDLPLERDTAGRFLPWLIGFMVYLSILALAGLLAMDQLSTRWDRGVAGTLTVQIPVGQDGARALADTLAALRGWKGVARAEAIPSERVAALLEPWLGPGARDAELPLPRLIDVELAAGVRVDTVALTAALSRFAPGVAVDDHRAWLKRLVDMVRAIEALATGILGLVGAITVTSVVFVTRTGLAVHREAIEVLHLIGAQDSYIARQFAGRAFGLGLRGGLLGLTLAAPTIWGVGWLAGGIEDGLIPEVAFGLVHWAILAAVPPLTALIALTAARWAVLRALRRML